MIYELLYPLSQQFGWASVLNVLRYTPFRAIMATLTAMLMSFLVAPWFIKKLRGKQISQIIREEGPATHFSKRGTPTMGGALILASLLVPTVLWADVTNVFVIVTTAVTAGYGLVGYLDDRLKIEGSNTRGLPGRYKLLAQFVIGGFAMAYLFLNEPALPQGWLAIRTRLAVPFVAYDKLPIELPVVVYMVFALVFVVYMSNAVNLTDGLDGLAISVFAVAAGAFTALTYVSGHREFAEYLQLTRFSPLTGELTVFCGALVGASLGVLWWNSYPADIFMGDVGSLGLGGALGTVALLIKQEFLLVFVGGIFVMEALSVIIQVGSFKLTGKRVFRMAPLHHHFELVGWSEPKVITRFIIMAIIFALFSLTTLKLR